MSANKKIQPEGTDETRRAQMRSKQQKTEEERGVKRLVNPATLRPDTQGKSKDVRGEGEREGKTDTIRVRRTKGPDR